MCYYIIVLIIQGGKFLKRLLILLGKIIVKILNLLGRNAGNLPGIILWHLSGQKCCSMFKVDCPIIAVTGTNGKTSVTNCIAQLFEKSGKNIIINREGNNLDTGICSLLLRHCDMSGRVKADYLILETDESHVPVVYSQMKLETLVVLNFFRDQLDRNGEMETLIQKINGFCKTFDGNLILNGDDPNTARLGCANPKNKNVKYFHAEPYKFATEKIFEASEGRFCPFCSEPLEYDYYQYSHIGKFICKNCKFGDYKPYITASNIDLEKPVFTANGHKYSPKLNSIYNIYNMTAVAGVAKLYNIKPKITDSVISKYTVNNGRMETFMLGDRKATLNLAKNPVGANMTLRVMNEMNGDKELLFVLNDNVADGLDVSWIWDINFSIFERVTRVVTSGTRAYDIAVRIKCSGYDPEKITVCPDLDDAVNELARTEGRKFVIANYTAVQPTRQALKRYSENGGNDDE
ncbi:MAG: MurT ligase domain-containing protein [Ruminococcus sp.]|nr:MurT ligase domain-containing protein [Ruminococcus sp.]